MLYKETGWQDSVNFHWKLTSFSRLLLHLQFVWAWHLFLKLPFTVKLDWFTFRLGTADLAFSILWTHLKCRIECWQLLLAGIQTNMPNICKGVLTNLLKVTYFKQTPSGIWLYAFFAVPQEWQITKTSKSMWSVSWLAFTLCHTITRQSPFISFPFHFLVYQIEFPSIKLHLLKTDPHLLSVPAAVCLWWLNITVCTRSS